MTVGAARGKSVDEARLFMAVAMIGFHDERLFDVDGEADGEVLAEDDCTGLDDDGLVEVLDDVGLALGAVET